MSTVLVVDDKEMLRDSVGATLQRAGFGVVTAEGGAAALELIARRRPDCVLTDLKMNDVPADIARVATGTDGATVSYTPPTASDEEDSTPPSVNCDHASGSTFAVGSTTVTCTATDNAGNTNTRTVNYTVIYRFDGFLQPENGEVRPDAARPGHGLELRRPDVERFAVA